MSIKSPDVDDRIAEDSMKVAHESWSEAADWEDPLNVAVLYGDTDTDNGCGHALKWKADRLVDIRRCPICREDVGMICDGLVASNDPKNQKCSVQIWKAGISAVHPRSVAAAKIQDNKQI